MTLTTSHEAAHSRSYILEVVLEHLHENLLISHSPSQISDNNSHMVDCIHGPKDETHVLVVHEEHFDLHMLEEDQAPEFPLGESHTFMEEK